jgi:cyclohexanone monooxygenase
MNLAVTSGPGPGETTDFDVVVVGAGFAGLYALHKLRSEGHKVRVFEAGSGVGGVWYWNRYPGARVDVEVREYSYGFSEELEREWRWSEKYASQPELERYANHVADRFDLKRDIQLDTRVTEMVFDEAADRWRIATDRGDRVTARYCVMASGCLSVPKDIDVPGVEKFKGELYRTSRWPKEKVSFAGKRVAVVGTGSSGIQIVPVIAEEADQLTVFQRTAAFSLPSNNGPMQQELVDEWIANRVKNRRAQRNSTFGLISTDLRSIKAQEVSEEERRRVYQQRWDEGGFNIIGSFINLLTDEYANDTVADFVRDKIRETVTKPGVAEKLLPSTYPIFTKRPAVDVGYFETFNRDNVTLVDVSQTPIEVTETGIRAGDEAHDFDIIVLAIGFDAMTGALGRIDIRGRGGRRLKDEWADGAATYLGLAVAGFPNMFLITGPGSPSVLGNTMGAIEHNSEWIAGCIGYMAERQLTAIEPTREAQAAWMAEVRRAAEATLYPRAKSWYNGDNVAGKPRVFLAYLGGWTKYLDQCEDAAAKGYEGFALASPAHVA